VKKLLLLSMICLSLAACDNKTNTPKANDTTSEAQTPETDADRNLSQKVRQAIQEESQWSGYSQRIQITSSNGIVTLRGAVPSEKERNDIAKKISSINGVKRVDNLLAVGQQR
jgi:hyperosmotically inducible protein